MKSILDGYGPNEPCPISTVEDGCNLCPHWRKETKKLPERIPCCFGGGPEEKAERDRLKKEAKEKVEPVNEKGEDNETI